MYWSELDGVYFVEGAPSGASKIRGIKSELMGGFSQSQLKTLDHLKRAMVREVRKAGGNAVIDFQYGQKNTFWSTIFSLDDVYWRGSGTIASISPNSLPQRS